MDLNTHQDVHLSHYWNVIRKRWKIAFAILVVVMLGTFLASWFQKPLYRSTIRLQIDRESNRATMEDFFGVPANEQEFLQTQYVLLKSRGLALQVVEDQKLWNDAELYPPGTAGKTPKEMEPIKEGIASGLLGSIDVTPVRNTALVDISYVGTSPRLARKITEAWGDSFIRQNIARKVNAVHEASTFLTDQIASVRNDLEQAREELSNYGRSRNIISVDEGTENVEMSTLSQVQRDYTDAQNEESQKSAAYTALQRTPPDIAVAGDLTVGLINEQLNRQENEYNQKRSTFLAGHPEMRKLADEMAKTRARKTAVVQEAYRKRLDAARAEMSAASSRVATLRASYDRQRGQVQRSNVDAAKYLDLRMTVETKQAQLANLQKQLSEAEVTARLSGSATSNIHWVDHALPAYRFNLSMQKNLQSAFPLGLVLGLAAIFFLEYMDRSVKTPEDLERVTRLASLGVIPAAGSMSKQYGYSYGYGRTTPRLRAIEGGEEREAGIELIPHTDARSPIAEAYRAFRTSLLLASANSPKVIVITSSFAREGKTTTSVNLATVLAQMGKPVLLLDADLRRPRLQKVFTGKMNLGLVNYLAANIPLDDIIQPTDVTNLSVVLSGPIPPNPSELLASDRMKHLIAEMRAKYAYVIFDSPPVLAVTDAIVLGAAADGVVLTVHGGKTPRELVQRSAERLRQANIPVLGALLNNLDLHQYGYTYKKGYYEYYESADDEEKRRKTS
ncbi:MAG TPA: polysaccharide biosynthesis tyrosine autokinase [Thermoanaerobaculia bacterium]|nr:polysaccharide biosynthesis tyrosine autokinase [Thermoanaerobaculia bacterium]